MSTSEYDTLRNDLSEDGVVCVRSLLDDNLLKLAEQAIEFNLAHPSPMSGNYGDKTDPDKFFFIDFNNWRRIKEIEEIFRSEKILSVIQNITSSKDLWFFHDHILVKGVDGPATPWHHDRPYYLVDGPRNVSVWISITPVKQENSLVFIKGSHKAERLFVPANFRDGKAMDVAPGFELLTDDVIKELSQDEYATFDLEPGDALVFNHKTLHKSYSNKSDHVRKALSLRYISDGSTLTKEVINATPPFDRMGLKYEEGDDIPEEWFPKVI